MRRLLLIAAAALMVSTVEATARAQPYFGEIQTFPYTFCPQGWLRADGSLVDISQYEVLFVLIGTTYGGDGLTNFALPKIELSSAPSSQASATAYAVCIAVQGIFPTQN